MNRPYDVLTFDCYGTLIDWETGIGRALQQAADQDGLALPRERILDAYHQVEPAVQAAGFRLYREVLREAAVATAEQLGWQLEPAHAGFLADSLANWEPFPDTNPTLEWLKDRGYRLGILSNVDDNLLAGSLRRFSVEFDLLVTAERVRSYKPAHGHFAVARQEIGQHSWLHVAQSYFHDVEPAAELGIPVVWVNRKHEQPRGSARPDAEVPSLHELPAWLE